MQPSMGTLNFPSSRIVKDSTPSRRRILRYINFGIGESSPILIFGHGESSPNNIWSMVNLERTCVLLFYYFLCLKVNLDLEKTNQLGEFSPNYIFACINCKFCILLSLVYSVFCTVSHDTVFRAHRHSSGDWSYYHHTRPFFLAWLGGLLPYLHLLIISLILFNKSLLLSFSHNIEYFSFRQRLNIPIFLLKLKLYDIIKLTYSTFIAN